MISTKSKLLLASTALVAVTGTAFAEDLDAGTTITDNGDGSYTTTVLINETGNTVPGVNINVADSTFNVGHNITSDDTAGINIGEATTINITGGAVVTGTAVPGILAAADVTSTINITDGQVVNGIDLATNVATSHSTITVGASGDAGAITVGNGGSTITIAGGTAAAITTGTGVDSFTVTDGTTTAATDLGDGNNVVTVNGTTADVIHTLTLGAGDNTVTVSSADATFTNDITAGNGNNTVTVSGTITSGDITLGDGDNNVTVSGTANAVTVGTGTNTIAVTGQTGAITAVGGDDTITVSGDSAQTGAIDLGAGINSLTVTGGAEATPVTIASVTSTGTSSTAVFNTGYTTISGAIAVDNLTVAGTVSTGAASTIDNDVTVSGVLNAGHNLTITGDLTNTGSVNVTDLTGQRTLRIDGATGDLENIALSVDAAATNYSLLDISNGSAVLDGATAPRLIIPTAVADRDTLGAGVNFADIVTASGEATGVNDTDTFTTGNAFFDYTWTVDDTNNSYDLNIAYKTGVSNGATLDDVVAAGNNVAVAAMLETDLAGAGDLTNLYTEVLSASDTDAAIESISPDVSGGIQAAAVNTSVASTGTISNRLSSLRGIDNGRTGAVAGDHEMHANRGMWIQAFGTTADQDDRDGVAGFEATTGGMAIGVDSDDIMENTRLGVAFAYAVADVESDATNNAETDIDTYQLSFYGSHDMSNGVYVDGMLSYAWNEHEAERTDFLGDTYEGDFDGTQWSVKAEVGKSYDWKNTKVTPNVGVHYINIETDDYSETGAGVNGQRVESDDVTALLLSVGSDIEWEMMSKDGSTYKPYLRAKYSYDTEADNAVTSATFLGGGSAFTSEGAEVEEHTITLGTGVNVMTAGGFEFTASYDADIKEDFLAHTGVLNARWAF